MVKKGLFVLIFVVIVTTGVFAQKGFSLSAGIGGLANISETKSDDSQYYLAYVNGGGYVFFDATYVELSLGISGGPYYITVGEGSSKSESDFSKSDFNIGILGKYPFWITEKFALFPMLGFDYAATFSVKNDDGEEIDEPSPSDFSEFWFKIGCGVDFAITPKIYIRFTPLLGFRSSTTFETDNDYSLQDAFIFTARLGVGYRF